jgi:hypothetical protein
MSRSGGLVQTKVTPVEVPSATDSERKPVWPRRFMDCFALHAHTRLGGDVTREWLLLNQAVRREITLATAAKRDTRIEAH